MGLAIAFDLEVVPVDSQHREVVGDPVVPVLEVQVDRVQEVLVDLVESQTVESHPDRCHLVAGQVDQVGQVVGLVVVQVDHCPRGHLDRLEVYRRGSDGETVEVLASCLAGRPWADLMACPCC